MGNVVLKTALRTVLIVLIALFMAFGVASIAFPQHMATLFENMGAYSFATGYSGLAYAYKKSTANLARCVDDSILAHDDENIINYGEMLIARNDFEEFASAEYKQFITGNLACAKYNKGEKDSALEIAKNAMAGVEGFPKNNALAALAIRAAQKKDALVKEELYKIIIEIVPTEEQTDYHGAVIAILT